MKIMARLLLILSAALMAAACSTEDISSMKTKGPALFDAGTLTVKDSDSIKKVRGQVLYVPIYSNIPCRSDKMFDLSAFIAIHNTDVSHPIRVTKVVYFDNDGKPVRDFLGKAMALNPLAATNFYIPHKDQSGVGANFLVEWVSEAAVSEPLIESVMLDCETHKGLSFLSKGKVIREIR